MHLVPDLGQIILEKDDPKILFDVEKLSIHKMLKDKNSCYQIYLLFDSKVKIQNNLRKFLANSFISQTKVGD